MTTLAEGCILKMQRRCQNTQNVVFPGKLRFTILWLLTPDWVEGGEEITIIITTAITAISFNKFPDFFFFFLFGGGGKRKGGRRVGCDNLRRMP